MRDGDAPELARWVREGTHRLVRWETDWSSQTGACQAGLLHGNNDDMPAFRWWEKDRGRAIVTNHPRDAAELERRISDGRGLLHADGASRANILSGDATHTLLTMSTVLASARAAARSRLLHVLRRARSTRRARCCSRSPTSRASCARRPIQRRRDVRPRIERGWKYALVRAYATVVQRDLQVEAVLGDVYAGRPVVYTTFLAYDEVAHHSGLERADTLAVLRHVDHEIGRIARTAARRAAAVRGRRALRPRPDAGRDVPAALRRDARAARPRVCATDEVAASGSGEDEAMGRMGAALTEASRPTAPGAGSPPRQRGGREVDGEVRSSAATRTATSGPRSASWRRAASGSSRSRACRAA